MHPAFKPLRYVFYRILKWKMRDPRESTPVLVACLATAILLESNALLVFMLRNVIAGDPLIPPLPGRAAEYAINATYLCGAYFAMRSAWVSNGKLLTLQTEFAAGTWQRETLRTWGFWLYVILTVCLPFVVMVLASKGH